MAPCKAAGTSANLKEAIHLATCYGQIGMFGAGQWPAIVGSTMANKATRAAAMTNATMTRVYLG